METVKLNHLITKLKAGNLSKEEENELLHWMHHFNIDVKSVLGDEDLLSVRDEMWQNIKPIVKSSKTPKLKLVKWLSAAAAIIAVTIGIMFYKTSGPRPFYIANDIASGVNAATLTLADGRKIDLSKLQAGEIAKQAGVIVYKDENDLLVYEVKGSGVKHPNNTGFNTLTTNKGQTYKVVLPDGSRVWVNAASSIKYAANFGADKIRAVELQGEAYFEVAKSTERPFRVTSKGQEVEVLGTHFNVNSYEDEKTIRTTLMEGSVKVKSLNSGLEKIIQPNQQAVFNGVNLQLKQVNTAEVIDWKEGKFVFSKEDIESLMRKIARWYNVEVIYESEITKERFGGQISRSQPISKILESLQLTGLVHFKVEGRRVTVLSDN